ncbi:MAG: glycosyltransferase involved in cell wall biosynthesis [Mariniflexile sp.]|jgi:glycosyltransferase involved in cell wall biosynthesis
MLLSVIIPVYNVEKYIEKCILSVVNNNLPVEDFEIIVVDDDSPDNSVSIVRSMMTGYAQIKLISQKNKGLGGARNTGILNASGKYVLFLDADDYLKENALKYVITFASENKLDILEFGAIGVGEKGDEVYRNSKLTDIILSGFEYLDNSNYMNSACNKLYAVSFLNKYALRFKERIFIEDFEFNTRAFYYANKVQAIANILGSFVQTANSITRNVDSEKNLKMVEDIREVIDLTLKFEEEVSNFRPNINKIFKKRVAFLTVTLLYNLMKLSIVKKQRKLIIEDLKRKKLYPIKTPIRNKNKNLFRVVVNNEFVFFQLCNLKQLLKN